MSHSINCNIFNKQYGKYEHFYQIMHKVDYNNKDEGRKEGKSSE